jgi:hypothetical protein
MGQELAHKIVTSKMRKSHQTDLIRIYLLATYGGVWADLTTICTRPLDNWVQKYTKAQFIVFTRDHTCDISSWWLACPKSSTVAKMMYEHFLDDIEQNDWKELDEYFHFHMVFKKLCQTNSKFKHLYNRSPKLSSHNAHIFQDSDKSLNKPLTNSIKQRVDAPFTSGIYKLYGRSQGSMDISHGTGARYLLDNV